MALGRFGSRAASGIQAPGDPAAALSLQPLPAFVLGFRCISCFVRAADGLFVADLFRAQSEIRGDGKCRCSRQQLCRSEPEFTLCLFATAPLLLTLLERKRWIAALGLGFLLLGFFCDMMFVVIARTAFVYVPVLLALFAVRYFRPKMAMGFLATALMTVVIVGFASPYVRHRVQWIAHDADLRAHTDVATSDGERMAYWRTSVRSIEAAPVFGHGTGSTKQLFEREAAGKAGEWANLIRNPHNQTLYVAIQWGLLGCIVLYAMWYFHLALFFERSFAAWIGLVVVVQNFVSSLVNSHLFDFHEGWIYVLGVGVAGGMIAAARRNESNDAFAKTPPWSGI
jgi:O-antigen ligase